MVAEYTAESECTLGIQLAGANHWHLKGLFLEAELLEEPYQMVRLKLGRKLGTVEANWLRNRQ